jgi:predicted AAA+ superfamily ATPase
MIKRKLLEEIKRHLNKREITFIVGPRQAGKTTLMLMLKEFLEREGKKTLFFNLDIEYDKEFFTSQSKLIKKIELELGKQGGFVFIDEIQRKEDAGLFLKGIYDMNLPYKFIVSGSGSVELKERIQESLVGRKRIFELSTVTFEEFINHKTSYRYEDRLLDFFETEKTKVEELLEEYLIFGGYPRVILEETKREKLVILNEIFQSYIERDISYLLRVQKTSAFSNLVKILASQIGQLINLSEISNTVGISVKTLKDYLWYLEKTFIIERVSPFFRNVRKEISKTPIFYFYDLGLRNFAVGSFGVLQDAGFVFENFIFNLLKEKARQNFAKIYFWRTKDKSEVDFVVERGNEVIPVEVKYKRLTKPEITRGMRSFIERYKPKKAFIVNLELESILCLNSTKLYVVPYYKLLTDCFL